MIKKGLFSILVPLIMVSCLETPELSNDDGPQASVEEVQTALVQAWGDADPGSIALKEFRFLEREQRIQDYSPRLVYQEGFSITERKIAPNPGNPQENDIYYKGIHQTNEISDGESKFSSREENFAVACVPGLTCPLPSNETLTASSVIRPQAVVFGVEVILGLMQSCVKDASFVKACQEAKADACDLRCHNLNVAEEIRPAPPLVAQQANCAGLPHCEIRVRKVSFDLVVEIKVADSTERQKITYNIGVSPDVPYLSRLMDYCYRGLVKIPSSSQRVLVEICDKVKNFNWGEPIPLEQKIDSQ